MAIGNILSLIESAGSVTAPTTYPLTLGSVESERWHDGAPLHVSPWIERHGFLVANGIDQLRHIVSDTVLTTGILPPSATMTATPDGTQATATLDVDDDHSSVYEISNNDVVTLLGINIWFKDSLSASPTTTEVLIDTTGSNNSDYTLDNFASLINRSTATEGVKWQYGPDEDETSFAAVTAEKDADDTGVTLTAKEYGTVGNTYGALLASVNWDGGCSFGTDEYFSGGADSGSGPGPGEYRYGFAYRRSVDGGQSALAEDIATANLGTAGSVSLASMTASSDADVDFTRWYRTTASGQVFYKGYDFVDSATTDDDDLTDTQIALRSSYRVVDYRPYDSGYPPRYRTVVRHQGKWFGGGAVRAADYEGTATFTEDSGSVTVTAGVPTDRWIGRYIRPRAGTEKTIDHLVVAVDKSAGTLTMTPEWEGSTGSVNFTVKDLRDPNEIGFTVTSRPNNWPPGNIIQNGITSDHPTGITAMLSWGGALYVWTIDGMWRIAGNAAPYRVQPVIRNGAVSQRAVVAIDEGVYWLGPDGIYRMGGDGIERISNPRGAVVGIDQTIHRINEAHRHLAHGLYCDESETIRWWVPLDNDWTCRHAIVWDLQRGRWGLDTAEDYTAVATVTEPGGARKKLAGDIGGHIVQIDASNSDGAYGFEPKTTADSGATTRVISLKGSPGLPTSGSGLSGVPILHIDSSGNFNRGKIASNTASQITLGRELSSAPSEDDVIYIGAIHARLRAGRFHLGLMTEDKTISDLDVLFAPDDDGRYFLSAAVNTGALEIPEFGESYGDLTDTDGHKRHRVNESGRQHDIQIDVFEPGCDPTFLGVEMTVSSRSRVRVGV